MGEIAIRASGLSKCYSVYENQRARLMHALWPGHGAGRQDIWALRDVDLEVARGEALAVIGRNGGGKTTLLEIIAGTLRPTSGEIAVTGRVSALLELGSGFNPEYTGRDNVLVNGLMLGIPRDDILRRFDEVLAFSEIGDAIDRPVKTYSSGMAMRLAFAVQVLADPEILIVDEALSVGDFFFQQKCFRRIRELRDRGVTLLFVSHDMRTVRDLCSRAMYLRQGRVVFDGDSIAAIRHYLAEKPTNGAAGDHEEAPLQAHATSLSLPAQPFWRRADATGSLLAVELCDANGQPTTRARIGETVKMRVYFRAPPHEPGHVSIAVRNRYEQVVTNTGSYACGMPAMTSGEAPFAVFQAEIDMMLEAGLYSLMVAFGHPTGKNHGQVVDDTGWIGPFQVDWDYENDVAPFWGMFGLPMRAELLGAHADE
jgi:lipopolysaccharide transport system ATP-binding protein